MSDAAVPPVVDAPADPSTLSPAVADELHRLAALYGSGLLADEARGPLDAVVDLAAQLTGCPVAMLNLVDRDVVRVRSSNVARPVPIPRSIAFCDRTINEEGGLVIPDLRLDPRFANTALVADGIRFYAGAPIHAPDTTGSQRTIGTLCLTDRTPRVFDDRDREVLRRLAELADVLIAARTDAQAAVGIAVEHKRLAAELASQHRILAQAERLTGIGSWRLSLDDDRLEWSDGVYPIYGLPPGSPPPLTKALAPYPPEAHGRVSAALTRAIEEGEPFDFEEDFRPASGALRRVRCLGEVERGDDGRVSLIGVFQDVTERHRLETALRRDADTDVLTGLANRAAFDRALAAAMHRAGQKGTALHLALIDLDGFKAINDTLGHAAGDDVLRQVGEALRVVPGAYPGVSLLPSRIGGDEFALIVEGRCDLAALSATLDDVLMVSVMAGGLTMRCGGSVGTAAFDGETVPRDLVHRADVALYAAKRARVGERRRHERRVA